MSKPLTDLSGRPLAQGQRVLVARHRGSSDAGLCEAFVLSVHAETRRVLVQVLEKRVVETWLGWHEQKFYILAQVGGDR